jgi:hypothetical protein
LIDSHASKKGYRGKVTAKCIECIYDDLAEGNWREQTEGCISRKCPLWEVRPKTTNKTGHRTCVNDDLSDQKGVFSNRAIPEVRQ